MRGVPAAGSVLHMTIHEQVAAHRDPILGDHFGDVAFAELVDDVVAELEGAAEIVGAVA